MRIAIVNDMLLARESLRKIIESSPQHEVVWLAEDGQQAIEKCNLNLPDLILMDLLMPVLDGVEATRAITLEHSCPILIVTASVGKNATQVYDAMSNGAVDATTTPLIGLGEQSASNQLLDKIECINKLISAKPSRQNLQAKPRGETNRVRRLPGLVAIGASNGGPKAVVSILSQLRPNFPAAVVVVQHIDEYFAQGFLNWLQSQSSLPVNEAKEGEFPQTGHVYLATHNDNLVLDNNGNFHYTPYPLDTAYRPSVDVFYNSLLDQKIEKLVAVILTGMGGDGAQGMLNLRRAGHTTVAQNRETCVSYGMPREAVRLEAAVKILALDRIAPFLSYKFDESGNFDVADS